MDATQAISDSFLESDEEESEEEIEANRGEPLAKLCVLKNPHIPETELLLYLGENVLGRDPSCSLSMPSPSVSKQHATISIVAHGRKGCHNTVDIEALVWDLGSMNGTRKGRLKLTPHVRYALSERDILVVADIPCQYVNCAKDSVDSPGDFKKPLSRNSRVKAWLSNASGEREGDTSNSSATCVNVNTEVTALLPGQEGTGETPVRASCLSFEPTPTKPQEYLVPETDSDSDGEQWGKMDRRCQALASNSDSYKSDPSGSTFLSPANNIVPESEDESPITPSVSKNRPPRHVSFSEGEAEVDVGRQQLKEKKAIVDDSEDEEGLEQERAALGGRKAEENGQHVPEKQESNVSLSEQDELPVSRSTVHTDTIPRFHLDSDTDVEGEEEEEAPAKPPVILQTDQPPNSAQFHMDSDTDVDDDVDAIDSAPKPAPSSADSTKPPHAIQPQATAADSATDVEDGDDDDDGVDAAVSDAASKAKPGSSQSATAADSVPKELHLDSDSDVDEENESGKMNVSSEIEETPSRLDIRPESTPAAPHSQRLDSDTDDEAVPVPAVSEPSVVAAVTKPRATANTVANLDILSDSDTDVEDNSPPVGPLAAAGAASEAVEAASDGDTDVDEPSLPPAGDETNVSDNLDSGSAPERQFPSPCRENTPRFLQPTQQNCSTPIESSGAVEEMETQAFHSPSSAPFIRLVTTTLLPKALSYCADSQADEGFAVAETQPFALQAREDSAENSAQDVVLESSGEKGEQSTREGSFQLGLSDSSFLQGQAHTLAMENTQAFTSVVANLEETQECAAADGSSLEATQAYVKEEEPAEEGQVDLDLMATQAYVPEPCSDSGDETDKSEREDIDTAETQLLALPTSSTVPIAETQPVSAYEEEEYVGEQGPGLAAQPEERLLSEAASIAATLPLCASDSEESDAEDLIQGQRKRKARPLQLEEEQTQPLTGPGSTLIETQPMSFSDTLALSGNDESDEEDSVPGPRKRKPKPLQIEDEQTQPLTSSVVLSAETQPIDACATSESDEEDSIPRPRKRKAKTRHIEDEQTQVITIPEASALETQPMNPPEAAESDEEDSMPGFQRRKAKPLQIQDEESQPLNLGGERRVGLRKEEEKAECSDPPKRQTRGKNKALPATRGRRGKPRPDQDKSGDEEPVGHAAGATKKRSTRQQRNGDKEEELERNNSSPTEEQDERAFREELGEQEKTAKGLRRGGRKQKTFECGREEQEKMERKEKEEQERLQAEEEKTEKEMMERERMERERAEREERERLEREERIENERKEREEKERLERAKREQEEQLERERKEREHQEGLERERKEKERLEKEKLEKEAQEKREHEEQLERERKEKERLEKEKREHEEQLERERKEKERLEKEKREHEEQLERERKEKERLEKEAQEKRIQELQNEQEGEDKPKAPTRGRRAARRTMAAVTELPALSASDDCPARRTRSRSNSSNSLSSERSASSVDPQESRGRGRGARRTSEPPQAAGSRRSTRMKVAAAELSDQDSTSSEISTCSSRMRGRGGRQQGRGRKTEVNPVPPLDTQSDQNPARKTTTRGRKSTRVEEPSNVEQQEVKADSQQPSTTRGRRRANANSVEATAANEEDPPEQVEEQTNEESLQPKRNIRGKGQRAVKGRPVEAAGAPVDPGQEDEERKGKKRELLADTEEESGSSSKISKGEEQTQTVQLKRRGGASTAQANNSLDSDGEKMEEGVVRKVRGRSRLTKREEQEDASPNDQDAHLVASVLQTPPASGSRKRQAPPNVSPAVKSPRSSFAAPPRARVPGRGYKVLFTGVTDEAGEELLPRLGGCMAKDVADMTFLVTDKVRRTVKFLCAVAKGIPIITTDWLEKSGKAGSFLPPNLFLVKDREQENKFSFSLQESLRIASSQPLLQGYEIHVTKSVKPEPVHMKDIITCSGAAFLPKMPTSHKAQTVVISCEEDWALCRPALAASLPVVSAEFILTGILQQRIDIDAHSLSVPASNPPAAGGRGRGRKKS